jgi:D-glycero-alpha-D-manno-heptose-7-phosphate kinase
VDAALVQDALLLVDAGVTRFSGINNWEVFKAQIEGDPGVRGCLARIVEAAGRLREALVSGRYEFAAEFMDAEWEARKQLAPGVTSPEIDRIVEVARAAGGAAKVCGAGGGGMVAVWCAPGRRAEAEAALRAAGFPPVSFALDFEGVRVREL